MINDRIIQRLEKERKALGMGYSKFSVHLGMAYYTYQNIIKGYSHITAERLYEISKILRIPIMEFFEGE